MCVFLSIGGITYFSHNSMDNSFILPEENAKGQSKFASLVFALVFVFQPRGVAVAMDTAWLQSETANLPSALFPSR